MGGGRVGGSGTAECNGGHLGECSVSVYVGTNNQVFICFL